MSTILRFRSQSTGLPRARRTCAHCGRRRMCTQQALTAQQDERTVTRTVWFCGPCEAETPPWPRTWVRT